MYVCRYTYMFAFLDKYCKITNVSIFVLGIYTCGTSVLLWWLYKGIAEICGTRKKHSFKGICVHTVATYILYVYVHKYAHM